MSRVTGPLAGVFVAGIAIGVAAAQDDGSAPRASRTAARAPTPDEAAIGRLIANFTKAFNAGDAKAIAAVHTTDAQMVDQDGTAIDGRRAIEEEYATLFRENPGLTIDVHPDVLRRLGPDTAIEDGQSRVTPKGTGQPMNNRYTVVYIKRDGQWLQASVRELPGKELTPHEHLKPLEWLLGDWVDEASDSVGTSHVHWSDDKNFLIRDFTIKAQGQTARTGTQRIGWNPNTRQIKSWVFDSEGGHGEELWAQLGNHWVIKATGVLQDGRIATATHILTQQGNDSCRWRTVDRTVGGDAIPHSDDFAMVRRPPKPGVK